MSINLKVQTQNLREKGSSTKHIAIQIAGIHDNLEQIARALDYDVKCHVSHDITICLRLSQDTYNLIGDYAKGLIDAANAYDKREEELLNMFDHLEIETLGRGIKGTQNIKSKDNERPKADLEILDTNWVRSPREPLDKLNEDVTNESSIREDIEKILEQIPELKESSNMMYLINEQIKKIQEYIRSKATI